jgi:hypothetical protein
MKASLLLIVTAAAALAAAPTYKVIAKIKIGGGNRWDYSFVDSNNHRLYVSHGTQTEVIDTNNRRSRYCGRRRPGTWVHQRRR